MTDAQLCAGLSCSNPTAGSGLCRSCLDRLRGELLAVRVVVADLVTTVARLDRLERNGRPDADDERRTLDTQDVRFVLPFRDSAAAAGRDLHAELSARVYDVVNARYGPDLRELARDRWYREDPRVAAIGPVHGPWRRPLELPPAVAAAGLRVWRPETAPRVGLLPQDRFAGPDTVELAAWLARHLSTVAALEDAGKLDDAVRDAIRRVRQTRDVAEQTYYGPCDCSPTLLDDYCRNGPGCECGGAHGAQVDLYGPPGASFVRCDRCGKEHAGRETREWLLKQARDHLLTATDMSHALVDLVRDVMPGVTLTAGMIRGYARRGAIARRPPHPGDRRRLPRYQVGEVMDHITRLAAARPSPDSGTGVARSVSARSDT